MFISKKHSKHITKLEKDFEKLSEKEKERQRKLREKKLKAYNEKYGRNPRAKYRKMK